MRNECTILEAKEAVKNAIKAYLLKDREENYLMEERNRLPLYLESAPGIGKTEGVRQVAEELEIGFVSFSLTHHTRNSLLGLPVIRDIKEEDYPADTGDGKYTSYTMSEVLAKVYEERGRGKKEGILLLDEFPCMSPTIMPVMLAFLQQKNIGTHRLPEGWVIVLCGNPPEYNEHSVTFDAAIRDRIRTIKICQDGGAFIRYAKEQGFHESIIDFLELYPDKIYCCDEEALVTCRGWENFSQALQLYESISAEVDYRMVRQFIKSDQIADAFIHYYRSSMGVKNEEIREILLGKSVTELAEKYRLSDANVKLTLLHILEERILQQGEKLLEGEKTYKSLKVLIKEVLKTARERKALPFDVLSKCARHVEIAEELYPGLFYSVSSEDTGVMAMAAKVYDKAEEAWHESFGKLEKAEMQADGDLSGGGGKRFEDTFTRQKEVLTGLYTKEQREIKKKWKILSRHTGNIFRFLRELEQKGTYTERFFYYINQNPVMLRVMAEEACTEYLDICQKIYAA